MEKRCYSAMNTLVVLITVISRAKCLAPGYSYAKFMGPVSGPEKKVAVSAEEGQYHNRDHDFIAKPDYHFEYGVEDPKSNVHQSRQETRHGDTLYGEYSVLDPDGKLRTVKYTVDKHKGFQATISSDGKVVDHHPQDPNHTPHDGGGGNSGTHESREDDGGDEEDNEEESSDEEVSREGDGSEEYYQ